MKPFRYHDSSGFTIIELLLTLGILGVVISSVGFFLIFNLKAFDKADKQVEIQYQSQTAMNYIVDKVIEKGKIISLKVNMDKNSIVGSKVDIDNTDSWGEWHSVRRIEFDKGFIINYNPSPDILSLSDGNTIFANYITGFMIEPLPEGETYALCKGVRIIIQSRKGEDSVEIENEIYFRNLSSRI